jgi:hypothetical protein
MNSHDIEGLSTRSEGVRILNPKNDFFRFLGFFQIFQIFFFDFFRFFTIFGIFWGFSYDFWDLFTIFVIFRDFSWFFGYFSSFLKLIRVKSVYCYCLITQSHQKTCGKDGDHPQGAFIKLGGYAFSTFSIHSLVIEIKICKFFYWNRDRGFLYFGIFWWPFVSYLVQ